MIIECSIIIILRRLIDNLHARNCLLMRLLLIWRLYSAKWLASKSILYGGLVYTASNGTKLFYHC